MWLVEEGIFSQWYTQYSYFHTISKLSQLGIFWKKIKLFLKKNIGENSNLFLCMCSFNVLKIFFHHAGCFFIYYKIWRCTPGITLDVYSDFVMGTVTIATGVDTDMFTLHIYTEQK